MRSTPLLVLAALAVSLPATGAASAASRGSDPAPRLAPLLSKPAATVALEGQTTVEIKFAPGSGVRLRDGRFVGASGELVAIGDLLRSLKATPSRTFAQQTEEWLDDFRSAAEARSGLAVRDFNLFYRFQVPDASTAALACDALNAFDVVEIAYPAALGQDPVLCAPPPAAESMTPNFQEGQRYREAAPTGVDVDYGNTFSGGRGIDVFIADVETGWTYDHEDLINKLQGNFIGWIPANYPWDHGTAVMGEMVGEDNGFGVLGGVYDCTAGMATHTPQGGPQNIPGAVMNAVQAASPGDVVVLEVQCFMGGFPAPHPCELDPAIFSTVQGATAIGIHVIAAAGNGNNNLDAEVYGGAFDLTVKDSGAIIVGASNGASLDKASFSNYGTRLTSHGWGQNVTTCGYGDLQGGPKTQQYTSTFSGTSSATPIVTSAAICVLSIYRETFKQPIDPVTLRTLLFNTGTPQGLGGQIGSRPDVRAAVASLGIPRIDVSGNLTPGGNLDVTSFGDPFDTYALFWSPAILQNGTKVPPFGYLYLDPTTTIPWPSLGTIGAAGSTLDSYPIPNNPNLSGLTSYFQEAQLFQTLPGTGSFTNVFGFTWQ